MKDLPAGSLTRDSDIRFIADADDRVVVTKDADFRHRHETGGHPGQLLLVAVGNTRNRELLDHFIAHHETIGEMARARLRGKRAASEARRLRPLRPR